MNYTKHFKKCDKLGVDTCPDCGEELDMQTQYKHEHIKGEEISFSAHCGTCDYDWDIICRCDKNGYYRFISLA